MATIDAIRRDPILKIFAIELLTSRGGIYTNASRIFNRSRKSLQRSARVSSQATQDGYQRYWKIESTIYSSRVFTWNDSNESVAERINDARAVNDEIRQAAVFFIESRARFIRFSNIDYELAETLDDLTKLAKDIDRLIAATGGDESAKKEIYDLVIGTRLEQLDAPYLFEIINFLVEIATPPPVDTSANAAEARAALANEAAGLAERLEQTNVDRRFSSALREYIDVLTERAFSPIKVELYSNKLRA